MAITTLIYCAGKNVRLDDIAIKAGFMVGAQLPCTTYLPLYFADQNWKKPDRTAYLAALEKHQPYMATVLDLERLNQLDEVLAWAEDAAQWVAVVIIIPKAQGIISRLPRSIGGRPVRLGFSVPTKFGGTELPVWEFAGWPVHLLGGSPHRQMAIARYMDVQSADGNVINLAATNFCKYWQDGRWYSITPRQGDAPYEAFRRSCENIMAAWRKQ